MEAKNWMESHAEHGFLYVTQDSLGNKRYYQFLGFKSETTLNLKFLYEVRGGEENK